ncbi:MAG TPA: TetR family transcriptional regulator [Alphaproteobacteria bacterium]|nr:TetR family transcriptional regulator [Alphaproteobacteria bacterium]
MIDEALKLCRARGIAALTFRSLANEAAIPAATLQSRFGKKEQILELTFRSAVDAELQALEQLSALTDMAGPSLEHAHALFRQLVRPPDGEQTARLTLLLEMLVARIRNPEIGYCVVHWLRGLHAFWSSACRFDAEHEDLGWFLVELQVGLQLTTACCHRPLEIALANDDLADRSIRGRSGVAPLWYRALMQRAIAVETGMPADTSSKSELFDRLLLAGAETVAARGASALSFRNVAAQAGVSLSAVTHYFPRRQSLIYAVYRRIFEEIASDWPNVRGGRIKRNAERIAESYLDKVLHRKFGGACQPIAHAELYLLAARDPSLSDLAWHMRMTRGLHWIRDPKPPFDDSTGSEAFSAHAEAIWMLGCSLVHMACETETDLPATLKRRALFGIRRFGV